MHLTIEKLILWPRDQAKPRRVIPFAGDAVNVITGQSQTGKSALIPIVDYCLGAGKCSIPVGKIREKTEWYGLLIRIGSSQLLLARPDPGEQVATTEMYFDEGESVAIPDWPEKRASTETVVNRLNQLAGLPTLDFAPGAENPGFHSRPSFRDMAAFNFQPQYVVANPYTLFFKADTFDHREKLKVIFPLVLGVVTNNTLALKRELADLRKQLQERNSERRALDHAAKNWLADVQAMHSVAKELGLLADAPALDTDASLDRYVEQLRPIPAFVASGSLPTQLVGNTDEAVGRLAELRQQEDYLAHEIGARRTRLSRIRSLSAAVSTYGTQLTQNTAKISSVGWFRRALRKGSAACPICGTEQDSAQLELKRLDSLAAEVERVAGAVTDAPVALDKEAADLSVEIRRFERELEAARVRRRALEDASSSLAARRQTYGQAYRLAGQLEQLIKSIDSGRIDSNLATEIERLRNRIEELEGQLNPAAERERLAAILKLISTTASHYAGILGFERSGDVIELDVAELTVRVRTAGGRTDFLWEIGSGANWLGLHLSVLLALHEILSLKSSSPVPTFLMLDQPSQVYFPERWPGDPDPRSKAPAEAPESVSDDIEGVRRIFRSLSEVVLRSKGRVQIIVTDHAGPIAWSDVARIKVVEEWRGENDFLIPRSWY